MVKVKVSAGALGDLSLLSPEYWLSSISADGMGAGTVLGEIVSLQKKSTSDVADAFVLDTGNSDRGLLVLPFITGKNSAPRVSTKKVAPEGAVILSRLRPYLQQVAYIPHGICDVLGIERILCSTEYYVLVSKDDRHSIAYLVPWLLSEGVQTVFEQATTGGHHPRFNEELILKLTVPDHVIARRDETSRRVEQSVLDHVRAQLDVRALIASVNGQSSSVDSVPS